MIKRILEKDEFKKVLDDIFSIHDHENDNEGHLFLKHDKDHIFRAFGETSILTSGFLESHMYSEKICLPNFSFLLFKNAMTASYLFC